MATDNTEQIVSQPNDLEPQDTQQSETPQLAQTLVDLNQTMSHMAMMLGDLCQKSQDTNVVSLQQPEVEESQHRRRGKKRRSKTSSSSSEASSGSGNESRGRKRRKRRSHSKTRLENRGETTDHEQDKVSVHVQDDDDNVSVLLQDGATNDNTNSTDETLTNLGEMLEDVEATGDDITPKLATIAENRWNKKLAPEKLTLIQEKYKRPANCTTVCSLTVNPEIWAKLPHYQQRADLNVSKIQESVRKAALISLQTAHSLTNTKSKELDVKKLLTQQVDSLALLGHISYELACLRRYKIKSVLKPEYASICVDDGTQSKYLFGDDLPKRLKDAKEASNVGLAVNTSNSRNNNYRAPKSYDQRNWRQTRGGHNYHAGTSRSDFFQRGKYQPPRKK
ncbi:Hypothetical predicted protein [Paramuricea clavata]|uniref:Uncharacterized protein n=1 Tax=Paramuricea clavata TaxID=317549 RepID=A0A6S7FT10_PARCT|nr:Hypothetical predicted protein [Paramuricea clavata]